MEKPIEPVKPQHPGYFNLVHPTKKKDKFLDIFPFVKNNFGDFSEFENKNQLQSFVANRLAEFVKDIPEDVQVYVCHSKADECYGEKEEFYIKYTIHNKNYEQELSFFNEKMTLYSQQVCDYEKDIIAYNEAIKVYNKEIKAYQKEQDKIAENERYLAARKVAEENLTKYITKHKDNLDPEVIKKLVSML